MFLIKRNIDVIFALFNMEKKGGKRDRKRIFRVQAFEGDAGGALLVPESWKIFGLSGQALVAPNSWLPSLTRLEFVGESSNQLCMTLPLISPNLCANHQSTVGIYCE
jgi:hypothetical protein